MVNTAKRRHSTRSQTRAFTYTSTPATTTPPLPASASTSSYHFLQQSSNIQNHASSSTTIQSHHRNSANATYNSRSPDMVPATRTAAEQTPSSSNITFSNQDSSFGDEHKDRVVSWILDNYERMPNAAVPRSSTFEHYQDSCSDARVKPVNAATFGKMIRMAFPGIKTRRLGNRGQSKYQYCDIQRRGTGATDKSLYVELPAINAIESYDHHQQQRQPQHNTERTDSNATPTRMPNNWDSNNVDSSAAPKPLNNSNNISSSSSSSSSFHAIYDTQRFPSYRLPPPIRFTPSSASSSVPRLGDLLSNFSEPTNRSYQQTHSPPSPPRLTSTSSFTSSTLSPETLRLTDDFANRYNQHCRDLYHRICVGQFDQVQGIYERFYYEMPCNYRSLLKIHKMIDAVWRWDCVLYDSLIVHLLPDVNTLLPDRMKSGLIQFTHTLPKFLTYLLRDYPTTLRQKKTDVARLFVAKLRRHLTLNQFAINASDRFRQSDLVEKMKADWNKLEAGTIMNNVFWICDCPSEDILQILNNDIPRLLDDGNDLKKWIQWEETLINKYLPGDPKSLRNDQADDYLKNAKQFMLKWKVYTGLLMQEFYAMNACSIDSLKAVLYFLDNLVLYHVEERIANMNVNIK